VQPDVVHVLKDGRIVRTGGREVIEAIEKAGFDQF
jgi:Fe-S cluster assembly ATP-binding protein